MASRDVWKARDLGRAPAGGAMAGLSSRAPAAGSAPDRVRAAVPRKAFTVLRAGRRVQQPWSPTPLPAAASVCSVHAVLLTDPGRDGCRPLRPRWSCSGPAVFRGAPGCPRDPLRTDRGPQPVARRPCVPPRRRPCLPQRGGTAAPAAGVREGPGAAARGCGGAATKQGKKLESSKFLPLCYKEGTSALPRSAGRGSSSPGPASVPSRVRR